MNTATKTDAAAIALLGGHTFEGTTFTNEQHEALLRFYAFNPQYASDRAKQGVVAAQKAYDEEVREYAKSTEKFSGFAMREPVKPDPKKIQREQEAFFRAGESRDVMRATSHDGRRVMAYMAKFLEPGDDPVEMIARLMVEAGYDVSLDDFEDAAVDLFSRVQSTT